MKRHTILPIAILLAAAACGGAGGDTTAPPQGSSNNPPPAGGTPSANTVSLSGDSFNPTAVTVSVGTTVKWKWENCSSDPSAGYGGYGGGSDCESHNVTFDDGSGASPTQTSGEYNRTFSTAGTFKYHCTMHSGMTGEIVVK